MKEHAKRWTSRSLLDFLRPAPGQKVEHAIFSSYSADLGTIAAALLALAGRDRDDGKGNRAALADALDSLNGKAKFLVQKGRLGKHKVNLKIAAVFDQFIFDVSWDESARSWHPKIALVNYRDRENASSWRLWIGSKNLTKSLDLDFGLLIHGIENPASVAPIAGIADLGRDLAMMAGLKGLDPDRVAAALGAVKWQVPVGLKVNWIRLKLDSASAPPLAHQAKCDQVILVSPFLDGSIVRRVGKWGNGDTQRRILSLDSSLRELARQEGKPLLAFSAENKAGIYVCSHPEPQPCDVQEAWLDELGEAPAVDEEEEIAPSGVHAKIIALARGTRCKMWVGSANATARGWKTGSAEVIAEIEGPREILVGLETMLESHSPVSLGDLAMVPEGEEEGDAAEQLEACRKRLSATLDCTLTHDNDHFMLEAASTPEIGDPEIALHIGLVTGGLVAWEPKAKTVPLGLIPLEAQTTLVRVRISLGGKMCEWLQNMDIQPPLPASRDTAAIAAHLGAEHFLKWVKSVLQNDRFPDEDADPAWDENDEGGNDGDTGEVKKRVRRYRPSDSVTFEDILACWTKDQASFAQVDKRLRNYLDAVTKGGKATAPQIDQLHKLKAVWELAANTLGKA